MNIPVCPRCKLPMKKDELFGPDAYSCVDGCGEWYWTAPKEDEEAEGHLSTE